MYEITRYQVTLRGYFETDNPDELVSKIEQVAKDCKAERIGQFQVYGLAPYVDYQEADVTNPQN